jgi:hypothetical protein
MSGEGKLTYVEIPNSPTSDNLILMQQRDKILITLSGAGVDAQKGTVNFDYGASEFVKEDINQNLVLFGVAGVNGAYVQVTGTDAKRITWSGMFYSKYATQEKERLEQTLCSGLPLTYTAIYNSTPYRVIIQSASFEIRKSCYITYNITLVEYNPIVFSIIKSDYWYGIPENLVTNPGGSSEVSKERCKAAIKFHCSGTKNISKWFSIDFTRGKFNWYGNTNKTGETGSVALSQQNQDLIACNDSLIVVQVQRTKEFLQGILNGLLQIFLAQLYFSSYYVKDGKKIAFDAAECLIWTNTLQEAFMDFLLGGCFEAHSVVIINSAGVHIDEVIKPLWDAHGSDGHICFSEDFINLIQKHAKAGSTDFVVYVNAPKYLESGLIEISSQCAEECVKDALGAGGITEGGGGSDASGSEGGGFGGDEGNKSGEQNNPAAANFDFNAWATWETSTQLKLVATAYTKTGVEHTKFGITYIMYGPTVQTFSQEVDFGADGEGLSYWYPDTSGFVNKKEYTASVSFYHPVSKVTYANKRLSVVKEG